MGTCPGHCFISGVFQPPYAPPTASPHLSQQRLGIQTARFLDSSTSSSPRVTVAARPRHLDELTHDYLTTFHHVKMYMMSLKSQITPIAAAVVDGIQGTLGRLTACVRHSPCI